MFDNLEIFRSAGAMARHAAQRQSVVAENIANADTPGYRTKDVTAFAMPSGDAQGGMKSTRGSHLETGSRTTAASIILGDQSGLSPNGNSVSLESEMFKSIEAERQHSRAMTIYKSSLDILRASLGRR
ncbi:FlgB family protein [Cognatishimia sp. MH4019]|uniref:FlgB family protein n=1 Tax=Cognatishimia sp. MH4019 TaxID=2854030 RepID=UPI001CD3CC5A|nr:FlgB family protein [Cognatishimia sp. MH4019]